MNKDILNFLEDKFNNLSNRLDKIESRLDNGSAGDVIYSQYLDNGISIESPLLPLGSEVENMASRYHERVKVGVDASGRPVYRDVYGNSREDVHEAIARAIAQRDGGEVQSTGARAADSPLWEEYAREWYATFNRPSLKPKSQVKNDNLMKKHIIPSLAGKRLSEIVPSDIQSALNERCDYSEAYLRDIRNLISQALDAAYEDGLIGRNPAKSSRVKIPSHKKTERRALTPEQKADIIANIPRLTHANDRLEMALLMFGGGMRPGEIFGLRYENINRRERLAYVEEAVAFAGGKTIVGDPKTAKGRLVPFDPRLLDYLEDRTEGYVLRRECKRWADGEDEPYSEQTAKRAWDRIKSEINVYGMTPYMARHTFATELQRSGVPMKTAIGIMGHSDERMLNRVYAHNDQESDILRAAETVQAYYKTTGI